jgi:hypothetical protein
MPSTNPIRKALEESDTRGLVKLTGLRVKNKHEAEQMMHLARTKAESVELAKRQYSHAWLVERGLPSMLPSKDWPIVIAASVGICVDSAVPEVKIALRGAMEDAVKKCYADGTQDPVIVRQAMKDAFEKERKGLFMGIGERAKEK